MRKNRKFFSNATASLQDKTLLKKIELLKKEAYGTKLKPMTKAQLKARAEKASKAIMAGRVSSIEDLQKAFKNW